MPSATSCYRRKRARAGIDETHSYSHRQGCYHWGSGAPLVRFSTSATAWRIRLRYRRSCPRPTFNGPNTAAPYQKEWKPRLWRFLACRSRFPNRFNRIRCVPSLVYSCAVCSHHTALLTRSLYEVRQGARLAREQSASATKACCSGKPQGSAIGQWSLAVCSHRRTIFCGSWS